MVQVLFSPLRHSPTLCPQLDLSELKEFAKNDLISKVDKSTVVGECFSLDTCQDGGQVPVSAAETPALRSSIDLIVVSEPGISELERYCRLHIHTQEAICPESISIE